MKTWEKPKLIVLARNTREEAVLVGCKWGDMNNSPADVYPGCSHGPDVFTCESCYQYVQS